jgi:hypothetical protein
VKTSTEKTSCHRTKKIESVKENRFLCKKTNERKKSYKVILINNKKRKIFKKNNASMNTMQGGRN